MAWGGSACSDQNAVAAWTTLGIHFSALSCNGFGAVLIYAYLIAYGSNERI